VKERLLSFFSRISVRIFAFNFLVVFVPLLGMMSLGTYERQLLMSLEHALVQQGRVMASALADAGPGLETRAQTIIASLRQRQEARIRVLDNAGRLLADSSKPGEAADTGAVWTSGSGSAAVSAQADRIAAAVPGKEANETFFYRVATFLYRVASLPVQAYRRIMREPQIPYESADFYSGATALSGPEIKDALEGRYGAATRISAEGQRSVTLYSAIPIVDERGGVSGAVLVSQSTYRILSDLYVLRLDIFMLFLYSVATAFVLSLIVSATITVPMRRLRAHAGTVLDRRGRLAHPLPSLKRRDEIGDLSRGFNDLTQRLERQIRMAESFASDVSHEFKNPLASIRSASELLSGSDDPRQREKLIGVVMDEVSRMERLLSGVQEVSRLDAGAGAESGGSSDPLEISRGVIEGIRRRGSADGLVFSASGDAVSTAVPAERMTQLLENLLDNAASFSPAGGTVKVSVQREESMALIRIEDQGPGIAHEHLGRIFERFYSVRPKSAKADIGGDGRRRHAGLGLSIVKSIAEGFGGTVTAANAPAGGAIFEVRVALA
jgi:two-component system sensor histidine kinase ChvG